MSDMNPKGTIVEIGGKEYRMLLSIRAIDTIQSETNLPLMDAMMKVAQILDRKITKEAMDAYVVILAALIQGGGGALTEEEIKDQVDYTDLNRIGAKMLREFGVAIPEEEEEEEDEEDEDEDSPKEETGA